MLKTKIELTKYDEDCAELYLIVELHKKDGEIINVTYSEIDTDTYENISKVANMYRDNGVEVDEYITE